MTHGSIVLLAVLLATPAASPALDGNHLLARSAELNRMPAAYAVPLRFEVHLQRPISFHFHADAIAYFQAPNQQALVITSMPRVLRRMFGRSYGNLDTVPQMWPSHYQVFSAVRVLVAGTPVYHLDARPLTNPDLTHVTFDLMAASLAPIAIQWFYRDGSNIRLVVSEQRIGPFVLPKHEDVIVTLRRLTLDAAGTAGNYSLNPAIPEDVFASR